MKHSYLSFKHLFSVSCWLLAALLTTLTSAAQTLPGSGNCLTFDGSSTYINCGTSNRTITSQVTVEAWIKTNSSDYQWIAGKYLNSNFEEKGFHLFTLGGLAFLNGRIGRGIYLSSGASSTRVDDGRWHHVAGTMDGTIWRIYVDGVLENSTVNAYGPADLTTTTALTIGNYFAQSQQYFQGDLDEVRVWRTARSGADIQASMCRKFAAPVPADLVAYYRLDQTTGLAATDEGSRPTPGALVSFAGSSPWRTSGAPLGDLSTSLYAATGLAGSRLGVASTSGDSAVVSGLGAAARGAQVYAVNSAPGTAAGAGAASTYFGVFTAGAPALPYALRLRPADGASCRGARQRPANDQAWASLSAPLSANGASLTAAGPLLYRGEFITVGGASPPPVVLSGDSALCGGATGQLTASAPGATGFVWSTGATTASLSGLGPGTYSVTASFAAGGSSCVATGQATIRVARVAVPAISGDSLLCGSTPGRLTASLVGGSAGAAATFRWSIGATGPSIAISQGGVYSVTASSPAGCQRQASFRVRAASGPAAFTLGADTSICAGGSVVLRGPAGAGLRYQWSDGSTGRVLAALAGATYGLQVSNSCGTVAASRAVRQRDCVVIPNVITPNPDDNLNPTFTITGLHGTDWGLTVFNRCGREVYTTSSYQNGTWGRDATAGLYYVLLTRPSTGYRYKGWVEVIR